MREIDTFSLEHHTGEYHTWPLRSRLVLNGAMLQLSLPGYDLIRQFALADGYLFVTDYDCPFEEKTCFILVDKKISRIRSERSFGRMYSSYWLKDLIWQDERNFTAIISGEPYAFTIRSWYIPYIYPKLGVRAL